MCIDNDCDGRMPIAGGYCVHTGPEEDQPCYGDSEVGVDYPCEGCIYWVEK